MKTPAEFDLELCSLLTKNGFTLEEAANVLNDLTTNSSLGEAISRVYYFRNIEKENQTIKEKEMYETIPGYVFNDPIAF